MVSALAAFALHRHQPPADAHEIARVAAASRRTEAFFAHDELCAVKYRALRHADNEGVRSLSFGCGAPATLRIMKIGSNVPPDSAVEAAIAHVLEAERAARAAIAQAQADGTALVTEARERARAVGERTERRMQRVRAAYDATTKSKLAAIAAEAAAIDHRDVATAADDARLVAAVAALAARLTGGMP